MLPGEFSRTMRILFSYRILSTDIGNAILLPFVALAFQICISIMPHVTEFAKRTRSTLVGKHPPSPLTQAKGEIIPCATIASCELKR